MLYLKTVCSMYLIIWNNHEIKKKKKKEVRERKEKTCLRINVEIDLLIQVFNLVFSKKSFKYIIVKK